MQKILIYLFPIAVNVAIGTELLITSLRLADSHFPPIMVGATLSVWALFTALCSFFVGRKLSERNAGTMIQFSGFCFVVSFLGLIFLRNLSLQFLWLLISGVATAFFCAPFQVFMKKMEHGCDDGVVRATASYSASWSFGLASGPFLVSVLHRWSPDYGYESCFAISALLMLGMALFVRPLERWNDQPSMSGDRQAAAGDAAVVDYSSCPDWAFLGWMLTVAAFGSVAVVKSLLPWQGNRIGISNFDVGIIVAIIYYAHSFVSLCLIRSRYWMFHPWVILIASLSALIGLIIFAVAHKTMILFTGACLLGAYSGVVGFCLVFYSLVHPSRAPRYVAVNEIVVGMCGVFGPLIAGGILNHFPLFLYPMLLCMGMILVTAVVHSVFAFRNQKVRNAEPSSC